MAVKSRKLKEGRTVYDIRVQYEGFRVSRTVRTTLTEARRIESNIFQELINNNFEIHVNREDPRFEDYADNYLKTVKWQKSFYRTETSVENLKKYFKNKRLSEITEDDFINYRLKRLENVSPATINRENSCLLRMLNIAIKNDILKIKINPLQNIKPFKEEPAENLVLSMDEYERLLDAAKEYFKRIIFTACNTGMRKMEILNLQFKQIKLSINTAEIELTDTKSGNR